MKTVKTMEIMDHGDGRKTGRTVDCMARSKTGQIISRVMVTGCAGFIGFHTAKRLLDEGVEVIGLDNLNSYYDVNLKNARLAILKEYDGFTFNRDAIEDVDAVDRIVSENDIKHIIHLAAQAGVRYSLVNPRAYIDSNLTGFFSILEACRKNGAEHLVYASSSSVYGLNTQVPFSEHNNVDHPVSLYAATKKANEVMAHSYSHLYGIPVTGLRFFTVYGPWGRPDMALFIFTKAILEDRPIKVYNYGRMKRDFTYIDDAVEAVVRLLKSKPVPNPEWNASKASASPTAAMASMSPAAPMSPTVMVAPVVPEIPKASTAPAQAPDPATSSAPFRVYNIGNSNPVELDRFIGILEEQLGRKAKRELLPIQPGDVPFTFADTADLERDIGYSPDTRLEDGIAKFVEWYKGYYRL